MQLQDKIQKHKSFVQENSRPSIEVKSEVDKFRGFLYDVISFEPDYILAAPKPRLHYFDETKDPKVLHIHELNSQTTHQLTLNIPSELNLPADFSSI